MDSFEERFLVDTGVFECLAFHFVPQGIGDKGRTMHSITLTGVLWLKDASSTESTQQTTLRHGRDFGSVDTILHLDRHKGRLITG